MPAVHLSYGRRSMGVEATHVIRDYFRGGERDRRVVIGSPKKPFLGRNAFGRVGD